MRKSAAIFRDRRLPGFRTNKVREGRSPYSEAKCLLRYAICYAFFRSRYLSQLPIGQNVSFQTTHWSRVIAAGEQDTDACRDALGDLCQAYWYPLYAYVRRRVPTADEARDLTQEFFARLLEKRYLSAADPARGRFRAFLITAFKNFLSNEWDKAKAIKRGGQANVVSIDFEKGERRYQAEPHVDEPADRLYERRWATTLLETCLRKLESEFTRANKETEFATFTEFLNAPDSRVPHREAAAKLGTTESASRVAFHRFKARYRKIFRDEVAQTVTNAEDLDDEVRRLFQAFA